MTDLARKIALQHGLDPDLVEAIIEQESAGNTWATRFEPAWRHFYFPREWASRMVCSVETERQHQATSWGLMQVMGTVARELGFDSYLPRLCLPEFGLEYGCKKLKMILERYENEEAAISAYNAGSARKTEGGLYVNQKTYVDPVCAKLREKRKLS